MLTLERLAFRARVRLAEPSRIKSRADKTCMFPGILSMSMTAPGIPVAVTTMACSFSTLLPSLEFLAGGEGSTALSVLAAELIMISSEQHGRIAASSSRFTCKPAQSFRAYRRQDRKFPLSRYRKECMRESATIVSSAVHDV